MNQKLKKILIIVGICILVVALLVAVGLFCLKKAIEKSDEPRYDTYETKSDDGVIFEVTVCTVPTFPDYGFSAEFKYRTDESEDLQNVNGKYVRVDDSWVGSDEVDYFVNIKKEYHSEKVHIYQFDCGIIYSTDNKETFHFVDEFQYDKIVEYAEVYKLLNQ